MKMAGKSLPRSVEVALVKDEKVLILILETLDGMGYTLREVPDVAVSQLLSLVHAIFVYSRHEHLAFVDNAPFGLLLSAGRLYMADGVFHLQLCASAAREYHLCASVAAHQQYRGWQADLE